MFDVSKLVFGQIFVLWNNTKGSNTVRVVQSAHWIQRKADAFSLN